MKRKVMFTFCADDFDKMDRMTEALTTALILCPVSLKKYGVRYLKFGGETQLRQDFTIEKTGKITWDSVFAQVNSVYAPYYKFV